MTQAHSRVIFDHKQSGNMEDLVDSQSAPKLTALPVSLEDVKLKELPNSAFYISEFITPDEEEYLLSKVSCAVLHSYILCPNFNLDSQRPQATLETINSSETTNMALRSHQEYPPRKPSPVVVKRAHNFANS